MLTGDSDELVPPSQMKRLSELASKSVNMDFFSVSGGGHNDTFGEWTLLHRLICPCLAVTSLYFFSTTFLIYDCNQLLITVLQTRPEPNTTR